MAVAFVNGSGLANSTSAGSVIVSAPASIVAGNLLLACVYAATAAGSSWATPGGWTQVAVSIPVNAAGEVVVYTKTATGSEPGSYTFTGYGWLAGVVLQLSGTTSLDGAAAFNPVTTTPTACTAPSQTPAQTGDLLIAGFGSDSGYNFTTPTSMTLSKSVASAGNTSCFVFHQLLASTSPTGAIASTQSTGFSYTGWSLLLAPTVTAVTGTAAVTVGPVTVAASSAASGGCNRTAWLSLNGNTLLLEDPSSGYFCQSLDLGYPATRDVTSNRPDRDGVIDRTQFMGSRVVTAHITALTGAGAVIDAVAAQFSPYMVPSARPQLHYVLDRPGHPERVLTVRGLAFSWPIVGAFQRDLQLQFVAADPVAYNPTTRTLTVAPGGAGSLFPVGDVPLRPVFRITGPVTAPAVTITAPGATPWVLAFLASFTVAAGHFVDVDTDNRTVLLDADPAKPRLASLDWTQSSWQWIPPAAAASVGLTGTATTGATQLQTFWQDGYLT